MTNPAMIDAFTRNIARLCSQAISVNERLLTLAEREVDRTATDDQVQAHWDSRYLAAFRRFYEELNHIRLEQSGMADGRGKKRHGHAEN